MRHSSCHPPVSTAARLRFLRGAFFLFACLSAAGRLLAGPELLFLAEQTVDNVGPLGISSNGTHIVGAITAVDFTSQEAFIWNEAEGLVRLGAPFGSNFGTQAVDVSDDGNFIVGTRIPVGGTAVEAVRWSRSPTLTAVVLSAGYAESISGSGDVVVGRAVVGSTTQGYRWTPAGGRVLIPNTLTAPKITVDGRIIVGTTTSKTLYRMIDGSLQDLGRNLANATMSAHGVSASGDRIVGRFANSSTSGMFLWTEAGSPQYVTLATDATGGLFNIFFTPKVFSADGRMVIEDLGQIYLDGKLLPGTLNSLLHLYGIEIPLISSLGSFFVGTSTLAAGSENGITLIGASSTDATPFLFRPWRLRFDDLDGNGLPDEVEELDCGLQNVNFLRAITKGTTDFAASRETLGYGDMISQYGRPWKPDTGRVPTGDQTQPAEYLRSLVRFAGCPNGKVVNSGAVANSYLTKIAFPAVGELHSFEMLLGNEAYADALDPTIGFEGTPPDDLSEQFSFQGAEGIDDLLGEELALLRGRELPGTPADWLNEATSYPEFTNPANAAEKRRVALYNRLPPNAGSFAGPAYRTNYNAADNYIAAGRFPQGQGDAYGHYLTAVKSGIGVLKDPAEGFPVGHEDQISVVATTTDLGPEAALHIAEAASARAQSASQVVELLHRRDYRENLDDPRSQDLFRDRDPERAWSMADWARRGALGAYLDWATAVYWTPADDTRPIHRGNIAELPELSGAVSGFQERLDTAGAGLDPLGLLQNMVPFGIDASGLQPGTGRSHFEQVRDAATRALENARKSFEVANQATQRLRDSDRAFTDFSNKLEDSVADFDQQLIEIFGMPSPNDPADNDGDPATNDFEESDSHPDLTSFYYTDEDLASRHFAPRAAPGQVQLALSELRVAALHLEQSENEIDIHTAQIDLQLGRIETVTGIQKERIEVQSTACQDQEKVIDRSEALANRRKRVSLGFNLAGAIAGAAVKGGNPGAIFSVTGDIVNHIADSVGDNDFDIERERLRIQCQKEEDLQLLEDELNIDQERRELKRLLLRTPQLIIDRSIQTQLVQQALGRLRQGIARGQLILKKKQRIEQRTEGQLLEQRWKDMSFRVFRNAALKNYRGLFDIAARYVVMAARAFAYEFNTRASAEEALVGIYRERRLGGSSALAAGLQGVLNRLNGAHSAENFNHPFEAPVERGFSIRNNFLGIGNNDFPRDSQRFRAWVESNIVERIENLPEINELATVSIERDYGPGIVISFPTELDSRNFFGKGPDLPFGNANFSLTRNIKIRNFAIRLDGVSANLGTDPQSGTVFVYLLPVGDSVLRESTNKPRIEDELLTSWGVVDQFLPLPSLVAAPENFSKRSFNPWRSSAQAGGNFLNEIKRLGDSEAQIELGQPDNKTHFNTNLAGRAAWNTRWLLVIPGSQWTSSSDPAAIRFKLMQFIYGDTGIPQPNRGMEDIRIIVQAYAH